MKKKANNPQELTKPRKRPDTKKMVGLALLIALVVVLQFVSAAIPPIGGFTISLVLIPVVMGAAVYGPLAGALLGGVFGVVVAINCINGTDIGGQMVLQANPVLCIFVVLIKGILAGFVAGWVYRLLKNKNAHLAMLCSAILCPVINTGVFVTFMLTCFRSVLEKWASGGEIMAYVFSFIILANFVPELLINIAFGTAGQGVVDAVKKNTKNARR